MAFTFTKDNVIASWTTANSMWFVPIMANKRPFNYRTTDQANNINSAFTSDGVKMSDLTVGYNFSKLLDNLMVENGITFNHSSGVTNFLKDLYIMPNTKVEYTTANSLTYIYTECYTSYTDYSGYSKFKLVPNATTTTGIIVGNTDTTHYNNISTYASSNNTYTAAYTTD